MPQSQANVIIIGANFAGLNTAKHLDAKEYVVTVIDSQTHFEWLPHIHELISRHKKAEQLRHNRQQLVERMGHTFVHNTVIAIDKTAQNVTLATGQQLRYDHLVIAIGNTSTIHLVEGAAQHALAFESITAAEKAAFQLQRLDSLNLAIRPIVLIGASIEGIEVLGEIIRRYQRQWRFKVFVVDSEAVIMSRYQGLDAYIKEKCAHLDIEWHLGQKVQAIHKDSVVLANGHILPSRTTLWCAGAMPPPLLTQSGLATPKRYAAITSTLQSITHPRIWLAGDCTEFPQPLDKQAYHALPMGKLDAQNIKRFEHRRRLHHFKALAIPSLMSFGEMGFLLSKTHAIASPSFIAAKEGVFQANFNLIKLPKHHNEWLELKDSLQKSASNISKLAQNTWHDGSLLQARYFEAKS